MGVAGLRLYVQAHVLVYTCLHREPQLQQPSGLDAGQSANAFWPSVQCRPKHYRIHIFLHTSKFHVGWNQIVMDMNGSSMHERNCITVLGDSWATRNPPTYSYEKSGLKKSACIYPPVTQGIARAYKWASLGARLPYKVGSQYCFRTSNTVVAVRSLNSISPCSAHAVLASHCS